MKKIGWGWCAMALVASVGCGVFGGEDAPSSDPPVDGPPGSDPGASLPPPPTVTGTPTDDELTEKFGIFVTPAGTPDGLGTRDKPLGDIQKAIENASVNARRVYVCQGTYKQALVLANGVSVIGGYDCSNPTAWKATGTHSRLEAPASPAVKASAIDHPTRFEGFDVLAPDGAEGSPNSIALIANGATALTVAHATLQAGKGLDGAPGKDGVQLTFVPGATAGNGNATSAVMSTNTTTVVVPPGALGATATCSGAPGHDPEGGGKGGRGGALLCTKTGNAGGVDLKSWLWYVNPLTKAVYKDAAAEMKTGAAGGAGTDGASATTAGKLDVNGYAVADGTAGADGAPGFGGRGGNQQTGVYETVCPAYTTDQFFYPAGGGGGGAGGCPGLAGTPGKGGGASIAALVVASEGLVLDGVQLVASNGGAGGKGTFGSMATTGSQPGTTGDPAAIKATAGGDGGRAGVSGSGAGGPSYALAYSGAEPSYLGGTSFKHGDGGAGVPESSKPVLGVTVTLPGSISGEAADKHAF